MSNYGKHRPAVGGTPASQAWAVDLPEMYTAGGNRLVAARGRNARSVPALHQQATLRNQHCPHGRSNRALP